MDGYVVTAQLVSTEDGYQLWSQRYDRDIDDIFAIQDEIARAVVNNLKRSFCSMAVSTADQRPGGLRMVPSGRHMLSQRSEGSETAVEFFQRAISIDPGFAAAYAGLGNAYLWLGWSNALPSREAFPKARQYAQEALQRDSTWYYAHAILGSVHLWYDWQWEEAYQEGWNGISLNPLVKRLSGHGLALRGIR